MSFFAGTRAADGVRLKTGTILRGHGDAGAESPAWLAVRPEKITLSAERPARAEDNALEAEVVDMLWKKTGVLYEFAGRAGAAIALNSADSELPEARALARFCSLCGTAFQIQDDILGLVGDTEQLGKPVGSDIREGKSTLLTLKALQLADEGQGARLQATLGDAGASDAAISEIAQLMRDLGVIKYAQAISHKYVDEALAHLRPLPDSEYKVLLRSWANYLIERDF